ncbi:MAG: hypothetical protein LBT59_09515 [Clostridiales bacterium]|nr:hypothetical protein [Clostridiales bacterium]
MDFDKELDKMKRLVNAELGKFKEFLGPRNRLGIVNVNDQRIISEYMGRAKQGYIRLALAEMEVFYLKLLHSFEEQDECEVHEEIEMVGRHMDEVAKKAVLQEDRDFAFDVCMRLHKDGTGELYGSYFEHQLLGICAQHVTQKNRHELEEALEKYKLIWRERAKAEYDKEFKEKYEELHAVMLKTLEGK